MKQILLNKLTVADNNKGRSLQVAVGPSEIGGCTARLWHRLNQTKATNTNTLRLAAVMGTAIHSQIEKAFEGDPRFLIETEVKVSDLMGHIDLIDTETNTLWDWKTTTKNSLAYFPSDQQRTQIQLYGWLANSNGIKIETVGLVAIPRDGNELDIVEFSEPYNEQVALAAVEKLNSVATLTEAPAPEKDASFCANYCQYFGVCPSRTIEQHGELILDQEVAIAAVRYLAADTEIKKWTEAKEAAKNDLVGTTGTTTDGIKIRWSEVSGRQTIDEQAVETALGFVPKKQGAGYQRLTIKQA